MNILWIYVEDLSPWLPAWGDSTIATPNIDRLVARGSAYINCFSNSPVCSPSRSGTITGCYPTRIGSHHHVCSRPGEPKLSLPKNIRTLPELFRDAGYFTYNLGKDDYNFDYDRNELYHGDYETPGFYGHHHKGTVPFDIVNREWTYWRRRKPGQFFFGQIGLWGGKNSRAVPNPIDPAGMHLPDYYPDIPQFREEFARHYECIQIVDQEVGKIIHALETDKLLDETCVFFFSDHGMGSLRHKQFCYDGGTHIPLILSLPNGENVGQSNHQLISSIDIAATSLALAGLSIPKWMDGRDFLSPEYPREYVVSARDRCDYTIDHIRSIRTPNFRYIRNFLTDRPLMQPQYRDQTETYLAYRKMFQDGELTAIQAAFAGDERPAEELYDHQNDSDESHNLVNDPAYATILDTMRSHLEKWIEETGDLGAIPESSEQLTALIDRWGKERCVNPEYQTV
ncbi:MAG TPA: sulfatase [Opitutae bacterium]|nr:sulfatase [Opitutae bacterium]